MQHASTKVIPYGRQSISEEDIQAVIEALRSDWLTQGPSIAEFEERVAEYCGARFAVAVANGTAALHLAALAAGFGPGDEVLTTPITFVASANCVLYVGAKPAFVDIDPATYCIDTNLVAEAIKPATKGVIPVHFAGQPCNMGEIARIAKKHNLMVIEDAAHAIGADYKVDDKTFRVGSCAHSDMTIFSFHPVKHITTGEGGLITTNDETLYRKLLLLRTHGITRDSGALQANHGPWYYEMQTLGYNYRITDFQCALGLSQLKRLDTFVARRRQIVASYNEAFKGLDEIVRPFEASANRSSYHLYVVQFKSLDRLAVFNALRAQGLGVNVHYIPVHLQPYYMEHLGTRSGQYPHAEEYYARAISLPLYPDMTDEDVETVVRIVRNTVTELLATR